MHGYKYTDISMAIIVLNFTFLHLAFMVCRDHATVNNCLTNLLLLINNSFHYLLLCDEHLFVKRTDFHKCQLVHTKAAIKARAMSVFKTHSPIFYTTEQSSSVLYTINQQRTLSTMGMIHFDILMMFIALHEMLLKCQIKAFC